MGREFLLSKLQSKLFTKNDRRRDAAGIGNTVSFSDDEDTTQISGLKFPARRRKGSAASQSSHDASNVVKTKTSTRGRGRGRGSMNLKQTTLHATLGFRQSQRSFLDLITDILNVLSEVNSFLSLCNIFKYLRSCRHM